MPRAGTLPVLSASARGERGWIASLRTPDTTVSTYVALVELHISLAPQVNFAGRQNPAGTIDRLNRQLRTLREQHWRQSRETPPPMGVAADLGNTHAGINADANVTVDTAETAASAAAPAPQAAQ